MPPSGDNPSLPASPRRFTGGSPPVVSSTRRGGPVNRTARPVAASMRPASTAAAPIPAAAALPRPRGESAPADRREDRARSVSIRHRAAARSGAPWTAAGRLAATAGPRPAARHPRSPSLACSTSARPQPASMASDMRNNRIRRTACADRSSAGQQGGERSLVPCPVQAFHGPRLIRRTAEAGSRRAREPQRVEAVHHAVRRAEPPSSEVEL